MPGQQPDLRPVPGLARVGHDRDHRGVDLGQQNPPVLAGGAAQGTQTGLQRPHPHPTFEPGMATQPLQAGDAEQGLAADAAGIGQLPGRLDAVGPPLGQPQFGQPSFAVTGGLGGGEQVASLGRRAAPERERSARQHPVELGRHLEAVAAVVGAVAHPRRQPPPDRAPVGGTIMPVRRQPRGEPGRIAEGEVEAGERHPVAGQQVAEQVGELRFGLGPGRRVDQMGGDQGAVAPLQAGDPDAVGTARRHRSSAPVDDDVGVENGRHGSRRGTRGRSLPASSGDCRPARSERWGVVFVAITVAVADRRGDADGHDRAGAGGHARGHGRWPCP